MCRVYGQQVSRKTVTKSLEACDSRRLHEENQLRFSSSKHFRFYWTKKHFISEWYFTKNHEIGSLVVRQNRQNRRLGPTYLSPGRVKKLQKFINFCIKVSHSANLKHSKSTWTQSSCDSCEMYKISTSRNANDLRQLSFWYWAPFWFTKDVYILSDTFAYRSAHSNLFLTLRVIHKSKLSNIWS